MREGRLGAAVQGPLVAIGGANDEILMNQSSGAAGCPGGGGPAAALSPSELAASHTHGQPGSVFLYLSSPGPAATKSLVPESSLASTS